MWQRIQTLFLVVTIIALIVGLIQPVLIVESAGIVLTPFYLLDNGNYNYIPYCLTSIFMVASATISIMEIRRSDNRIVQIKLGAFNSLMLVGAMICIVYFASKFNDETVPYKYGLSMYMAFVAVISNWLALRFIRRDERLVRDSDRLR
jgi:hypothetical protein